MKKYKNIAKFTKPFFDYSTMHGFRELYYSKKALFKLFWFLVVFAAIVITVLHSLIAVQQFIGQKSVTNVEALEKGRMLYPPLRIMYDHWVRWIDWEKATKLFNLTKPAVLYGLSFIDTIYSKNSFEIEKAEKEFLHAMSANNVTTLSEFYKRVAKSRPSGIVPDVSSPNFLRLMTAKDLNCAGGTGALCFGIPGDRISNLTSDINQIPSEAKYKKITFQFDKSDEESSPYNYLVDKTEYVAYLRDRIKVINPNASLDENANFTQIIAPPVVVIGDALSNAVELSSDFDTYQIKLGVTVRKWQNSNSRTCVENVQSITGDFHCYVRVYANAVKKSCKSMPYYMAQEINDDRPSYTCNKKHIVFYSNGSFPEIQYMDGNTAHVQFLADCECSDVNMEPVDFTKCVSGCEMWDYELISVLKSENSRAMKKIAEKSVATVDIFYPTEQSIVIMSEFSSQSWETFAANVGGVLGIWLGASVMSFIQTIYLCCCNDENETKEDKAEIFYVNHMLYKKETEKEKKVAKKR